MQSSTLSSRIIESAAGLSKDLFPNSINGYGALETTNELTTLRSAHKISHGASSSPRLSQALNKRQRFKRETLRFRNLDSDLKTASNDADEELSRFMLQECDMREGNVSSSRSKSISDLALADGSDTERGYRNHLRRNDSFEPELSRSKERSPTQLWYPDMESPQQAYDQDDQALESLNQEVLPALSLLRMSEDCDQTLSLGHHAKVVVESSPPDTVSARRKAMALSRLHLIFSQVSAATQAPSAAAKSRQTESFESSYNQLCGGEDAQEWAGFEASMFRTYSGQSQATGQDTLQRQQHEPSTMVTGQQASLKVDLYQSHVLEHLKPSREESLQQDQKLKKDEEQSKSKEPIGEFHCPWIACHSVGLR
jgi:hypothetical protein